MDRLITYPDAHNLSGCSQPIHMRSLIHPTWPILAVVTRRACGLATTPPQVTPLLPPIGGKCTTQGSAAPAGARRGTANWGNRTIRTTTRRRHAGRQLLMLPNPHAWGDGRTSELGCGARGRRRRLTDNTLTTSTARLEAAAGPAGPGWASRRRAERSSQRGRRAGGQATRRPEIWRGIATPEIWRAAAHGRIEQPGLTQQATPGTPAAPQAQATQRAPAYAETPAHVCGKPRPADAGRGFRYPVGYEV